MAYFLFILYRYLGAKCWILQAGTGCSKSCYGC